MGEILILEGTTINPISTMGERAGVCWGSDVTNQKKNYKRGLDCLESGHGRVMEFVNIEMVLKGYSLRVLREWYTHIGGAPTRLQSSTRYIDYENFDYIIPPKVQGNPEAEKIYRETVAMIQKNSQILEKELGIPREDAAMLYPLGITTTVVDKRNLRNLIDMSHQRLCKRAYHEYRDIMNDIYSALSKVSDEWKEVLDKYYEPKCKWLGYCPEKKPCAAAPSAKKKIQSSELTEE